MVFSHTRRRSAPSLSGGVRARPDSEPPPKSSSSSASSDTVGGEAFTPGRTSSSAREKRWIPTMFRKRSRPKLPDKRLSASAPGQGSSGGGRYSYAVKPSASGVTDAARSGIVSTVRETAARGIDDAVPRAAAGTTAAQKHSFEVGAPGVNADAGECATTSSGSGGGIEEITAAADSAAKPTECEGGEESYTTTSNTAPPPPATKTGGSSMPPTNQEDNTNNNPMDNENKSTAPAPKHGGLSTVTGVVASSVDTSINIDNTAGDASSGSIVGSRPTKSPGSESDRRGGRAVLGGGGGMCNASLGMSVLCLVVCRDEGSGASGGGGVRRWKLGEVAGLGPDDQGEPILRVRFSPGAGGDQQRDKSLRLRNEWHRLAIPTSLTEEQILSGAKLSGDAFSSSKRHFRLQSSSSLSSSASRSTTPSPSSHCRGQSSSSSTPQSTASTAPLRTIAAADGGNSVGGRRGREGQEEEGVGGSDRNRGRSQGWRSGSPRSGSGSSKDGTGEAGGGEQRGEDIRPDGNIGSVAGGAVRDGSTTDGRRSRSSRSKEASRDRRRGKNNRSRGREGSRESRGGSSGSRDRRKHGSGHVDRRDGAKKDRSRGGHREKGRSGCTEEGEGDGAAVGSGAIGGREGNGDFEDTSFYGGSEGKVGARAMEDGDAPVNHGAEQNSAALPVAPRPNGAAGASAPAGAEAATTRGTSGSPSRAVEGTVDSSSSGRGGDSTSTGLVSAVRGSSGSSVGSGGGPRGVERHAPASPLLSLPPANAGGGGAISSDERSSRGGLSKTAGGVGIGDGEASAGRRMSSGSSSGGGTGAARRLWRVGEAGARGPKVGDKFDCLDYFISVQTGKHMCKWREAEVVDVRHPAPDETQVLVHFITWESKWDRWVSLKTEPGRFAPHLSSARPAVDRISRGPMLHHHRPGSNSTLSTATPTPTGSSNVSTSSRGYASDGFNDTTRRHPNHGEQLPLPRRSGRRGGVGRPVSSFANGSGSPSASEDSICSSDSAFREAMRRKGLSVVDVEPDGNCLFRSVSHQIYGDVDRHVQVRKACVDHMQKHKSRFGMFVPEDFRDYLYKIRQPGVWGDDLEIRALEEMFDRPIEIFSSDAEDLRPMKIDFEASSLDGETAPIKLSYHGQSHYNSVRDVKMKYPLQPRRSKNILTMRQAQHARTPRSASVSRAGGGRHGEGQTASESFGSVDSFDGRSGSGSIGGGGGNAGTRSRPRLRALRESASFSGRPRGFGSGRLRRRDRNSIDRGRRGSSEDRRNSEGASGEGVAGGAAGATKKAGMALKTLFGGVASRHAASAL